ncbi:MAG TPA: hypothetical protein P5075_07355 [Eubacteriales bacterium]|nr:hypothetical protein [Eubacteriales bacterium]
MYERHDRSYLKLMFPEDTPRVKDDTRLIEDLKMNEMSVRLLTAYIRSRYGEGSSLNPDFKTIGDIDAYIYYEYYCNKYRSW